MNQDIHFTDLGPAMQTAMTETLELLTEDQKRKFTERRLDRTIEFIELKIIDMEKRILIAKEAIADIRKDKEMIR